MGIGSYGGREVPQSATCTLNTQDCNAVRVQRPQARALWSLRQEMDVSTQAGDPPFLRPVFCPGARAWTRPLGLGGEGASLLYSVH